jgi:type VI secretion system protein ImpG
VLEQLLPYYERELTALRQLGKEFADQYPKVARRLALAGDVVADPHVERLIESFAFLAGRIRLKLDDEFPEITAALLGLLYPHYLRPVPSMTVVQLRIDHAEGSITDRQVVLAGSRLLSRPVRGMPCQFRTCYPVELWPIRLVEAACEPVESSPFGRRARDAVAVVRLRFECFEGLTFAGLGIDRLRLFLDGEGWLSHGLHELLLSCAQGLVLRDGDTAGARPLELSATSIRPVGFAPDEGLLDYGSRSFLGYRLLTEYFCLPEKFLFVDLVGLDAAAQAGFGARLDVAIPIAEFERAERLPQLQQAVQRDNFRLGCTPAVNLFRQTAEPIRLDHRRTEYPVLPDARRRWGTEVYAIDAVRRVRTSGRREEEVDVPALYGLSHANSDEELGLYWCERRRPAVGRDDEGTDVFISLVDKTLAPAAPGDDTLAIEVTCTNRDLPARLPFGGGVGDFELEAAGAVARVAVLRKPTSTLRPDLRGGMQWRLISHLSLNHLSIVDGGRDALLEILSLYNIGDSLTGRRQIGGITAVAATPDLARIGPPRYGAFCRGVAVEIAFDEDQYVGGSAYLLAAVLERFLGLYAAVNSFTRLTARSKQRERVLAAWPPRTGDKFLL